MAAAAVRPSSIWLQLYVMTVRLCDNGYAKCGRSQSLRYALTNERLAKPIHVVYTYSEGQTGCPVLGDNALLGDLYRLVT